MQTQSDFAERAKLQTQQAETDLRLEIQQQWNQVRVNLDKVKATASQESAQKLELDFANKKFTSGTATASTLLEAEKNYFAANLSHIQARANLVMSRLLLRLTTNSELDGVLP